MVAGAVGLLIIINIVSQQETDKGRGREVIQLRIIRGDFFYPVNFFKFNQITQHTIQSQWAGNKNILKHPVAS